MYELKTILPTFDIKLPTCMYPVKPLSPKELEAPSSTDVSDSTSFLGILSRQIELVLKGSNEMSNLEIRQEKVFQQLQDLKNQLLNIRSQFSLEQGITKEKQYRKSEIIEKPLKDIVINAHPEYIPYGLLALQNVWKGIFDIEIKAYSHSTVPKISKQAEEFQEKITKFSNNQKNPSISITLIWKNCEHTEMISSPAMYVPIYGEVNVLRYLARVGPQEFRYEEYPTCNEVDAILDICYQLIRCSTVKGRAQLFRSLNSRLQKQKYFGGDNVSIADIAVCSTVKRLPTSSLKDMSENLCNWLQRVTLITMI